jgi:hypothetical protein
MNITGTAIVGLYRTRNSFRHLETRVAVNRYGQIPAVLVDAKSIAGPVVQGVWLGDSRDHGADGINYVLIRSGAF